MSAPIPLRQDFDVSQLRSLARRTKDGPQARRLLALAAIYDGATRTEAAKIGGVGLPARSPAWTMPASWVNSTGCSTTRSMASKWKTACSGCRKDRDRVSICVLWPKSRSRRREVVRGRPALRRLLPGE